MPQPYLKPIVEINIAHAYGGFRDDNWNVPNGGNVWVPDGGVTFTTDGDIATLSGTNAAGGVTRSGLSFSTTTYPNANVRIKIGTAPSGTTLDLKITFSDTTTQTITFTLTSNYSVLTSSITTGKTVNIFKFQNQSATGTILIDYLSATLNKPIVLASQDDAIGPDATMSTTAVNDCTFTLRNNGAVYTTGSKALGFYDDVYVYMGYLQDDLNTKKLSKVFGGSIMELTPKLDVSGDLLQVNCSGWAQALLSALVIKDYGSASDNASITNFQQLIDDIINNFVNTDGYALTTVYIQNIAGPPAITYMLFKNDQAFDAVKQAVDLLTAGDPTNATVYPAEFWVDNAENAHLAPLGNWGSDPNPSTYANSLNVGSEQILNNFRKDILNLKNKVHFITAMIEPPNGDLWTENNASAWSFSSNGIGGSSTISNDNSAGNVKVNSFSIKANWTGQTTGATTVALNYPSAANLALDITKFGGKITPARIVFYCKTDKSTSFPQVQFVTTSPNAVFTSDPLPDVNGISNTDWHRFEVRIGPFGDRFVAGPGADWTNINQIQFLFTYNAPGFTSGNIWVDGIYIEGQNHFVATDSTRQGQYGTRETTLTSLKHRKSTTQQALAKAELFRLHNPIMRGTVQVPGIPDILPGQKVTVNAPSANLSNATLRVISAKHHFGQDAFTTELELTDDLTNYQSLQLTSMTDLLLQIHTPTSKAQRQKDIEMGNPATLSGQPDFTTTAQTRDYPS